MATKGGTLARSFLGSFQSEMGRFNEMKEYDRRAQQGAEQYMRRMAQQNAYSDYKATQEQKFREKLEQIRADNEMIRAEYEHDLRMDEISARNQGESANSLSPRDALAYEKFRFDQQKVELDNYDTEIKELENRYRSLLEDDGTGIVSVSDKIEMAKIQDQIRQKQAMRTKSWYDYRGVNPPELERHQSTMGEWRDMNSDLEAMDLPTSVKNNIATKRAQRYGFDIVDAPVNTKKATTVSGKIAEKSGSEYVKGIAKPQGKSTSLRDKAIEELKKRGKVVSEETIKQAMRLLNAR